MPGNPTFVPGPRIGQAVVWAAEMHGTQVRKATDIPYLSHLLAVAAIAMEHGADEDQTIAAILHDVVEDTPATVDDVTERFGDRVAAIVEACSDADRIPKPPWHDRKRTYLRELTDVRSDALVVSMADKLHNVTSIDRDVRSRGLSIFARFTTTDPTDQIWYYDALVETYRSRSADVPELAELADEFARAVADMRDRVGALLAERSGPTE